MLIKNHKQFVKLLNLYYNQTQILLSHLMKYCLRHQHHHHQQHQQLQLKHLHLGPTSTSTSYSFSHTHMSVFDVTSLLLLLLLLVVPLSCVDAVGYSYTRFIGPVAGPEHKIYVNNADSSIDVKTPPHHVNVLPRLDYVAKPEYEFSYGVEDADAHILHNRNEMRDGDIVKGVYSLIDPDGALRVVKYTADEINGFQAEVIRNGVSSLHGQLQNDYKRLPPAKIINNNHNYYKPDHEQHYYPPTPTQAHTQTPEKIEANEYYPSSNGYTPNWEQLEKINQQLSYNPNIQYQPPPQPPIIYHYNNNEAIDDGSSSSSSSSDSSDSDYNDNPQTHYEVHEKPNNDERDNEQEEEDDDDDDDNNDHKIKTQIVGHKKKKYQHQHDEYDDEDDIGEDDEDDNDSGDEADSEEFEDYNETEHNAKNSKESNEYY